MAGDESERGRGESDPLSIYTYSSPPGAQAAPQPGDCHAHQASFSIPREHEHDAPLRRGQLEMKEKALARLEAPDIKPKRFRASDNLMTFLRTL